MVTFSAFIPSVLWIDLFTGFDVLSLDGVVLLATLLVPIVFVASRPREQQDALAPLPDEVVAEASLSGRRWLAPLSRSTATIDPAVAIEGASLPLSGGSSLERPAGDTVQPTGTPHEGSSRALSRLLALPDEVATRIHLGFPPVAALALAGGLALVWYGQRALLRFDPGAGAYVVWLAGLLVLAFVCLQADRGTPSTAADATEPGSTGFSRLQKALLVGIGVMSLVIWQAAAHRDVTDSSLDVVLLWLASIAALIVAATRPPRRTDWARFRAWVLRVRGDILITAGVALLAFVVRVYDSSSYPWAMSGDEGTFAITARSVLRGEITNPFSSGPWGYPTLLFILQGWLIDLTSERVGGARLLSAVLGTASVVAVYWLTRHHFGRWTGLIAGVIAATFNFHVFWSRNAQNAIAPMLFLPLALLFLDRGLIGGRRVDCLAAGFVIGIAQFFHPSNRILFPIAGAYVAYALLYQRPENRAELGRAVRAVVPNALWIAAGAIVGHLPLLAYFSTHRLAFSDRTNQVSVFASGWLEREQEITGKSAIEILWNQFQLTALLPFNTVPSGHFHPEIPVASWPLVIPLAIGMAIVTLTFWRRSHFGIALAFWATVAGSALTDGWPQTNRYTPAGPFLAIFAAIGIVAIAHVAVRMVRLPKTPVAVAAAAATLLIAGWHLNWYFEDANPVEHSSDPNTQIANRLAHEAALHGAGLTVYLSGEPRLYYDGFSNISYIAPGATGIDVVESWSASTPSPELTGPTLFAFVPERLGELEVVRSWFPDGTMTVSTLPDGEEILTTYFVDAPAIEVAGRAFVLHSG